jgi:hypothetical protein
MAEEGGVVQHIRGPAPETVAKIRRILEQYERGELSAIAVVTVTRSGSDDFLWLDLQDEMPVPVARLYSWLSLVRARVMRIMISL